MNRYNEKEKPIDFLKSFIPGKRDNFRQIAIKCLYLAAVLSVAASGLYIGDYFIAAQSEIKTADKYLSVWNESGDITELKSENSDIKGWLKMGGTDIDRPVYQTEDNRYYLNYNADKKRSEHGELFFDCRSNTETDCNLIIYGNDNKDGSVFGNLKKLRNISFYKKNSTLKLSLYGAADTYRIYAVFVLNASKEDDGGYIYNIYRKNFSGDSDFDSWVDEAKRRSVINTQVDVGLGDNILTLVTGCDDFPNARLVVMAKRIVAEDGTSPENNQAHANPEPLYPERWYTERGIKE